MHAGQVVETAPVRSLFRRPAHPYTRALVRSIPRIDREIVMEPIPGSVPSLLNPPPGCRYAGRCPLGRGRAAGGRSPPCRRLRPSMPSPASRVEDGRAPAV